MQKGQGLILVIVGLVIVAAIAGGSYYFGKSQVSKPQNPVVTSQTPQPTIIPVASPSATPDETTNWKTYTSTGYAFKYPSNGDVVTDQTSVVYISGNTQPYFTFTVRNEDNSNHLTTKQVVDKLITDLRNNKNAPWAKSQADQTLQTLKEYTNGQIVGIKLQSFDEGYPQRFGEVVEVTTDKIYTFHIGNGSGGGVSDNDERLLDKILSTFKFTQ